VSTIWSGNGGSVSFGGVTLIVQKWSRKAAPRQTDITSSATAGWQNYQGTLKGWEGTVTVFWDSDNLPEANGIVQNTVATMVLNKGPSGHFASGLALIDGPGEEVDNQQGVIMYTLNWKSCGAWTET
jgi:hypothetical protein